MLELLAEMFNVMNCNKSHESGNAKQIYNTA